MTLLNYRMALRRLPFALCLASLAVACSQGEDDVPPGAVGASNVAPCEAQWEAMQKNCPADPTDKDASVATCVSAENEFAGIGCQAQYDAWLVCTTKPGYDCNLDTGCEATQGGYFSCQSQAVLRTGCVRLGVQDATRCSDKAKPYAFSCLNMKAPAVCTQVVTEGAGIWCCPQL